LEYSMTVIIGATKDVESFDPLGKAEIDQLYEGSKQLLSQGVPLDVPSAVMTRDIIRLAVTLKRYRALAEGFVAEYDSEPEARDLALEDLYEQAQDLLHPLPAVIVGAGRTVGL
jgi:hypothetical protein